MSRGDGRITEIAEPFTNRSHAALPAKAAMLQRPDCLIHPSAMQVKPPAASTSAMNSSWAATPARPGPSIRGRRTLRLIERHDVGHAGPHPQVFCDRALDVDTLRPRLPPMLLFGCHQTTSGTAADPQMVRNRLMDGLFSAAARSAPRALVVDDRRRHRPAERRVLKRKQRIAVGVDPRLMVGQCLFVPRP